MTKLSNKVAIITGASSGIGKAIAHHLADTGANVVLAARRSERLQELANEITESYNVEAKVVETDVTKKEDVEQLVKETKDQFGSVDILVNNAGVMLLSFLKNDHVDEWEQMVDVNIKGVLFGIHASLPVMLDQDAGHIINVSSVAGHEVFPSSTVYSATKYAVRALSMGMEKELSRSGVRVTNISPGAVDTELTEHITDGEVLDMFKDRSMDPLEANDIARAVAYAATQPSNVNVNEVIVRPMHKK
ncbi:NAD(P)-dependent oxidoreductase [Halobacillus halophilus]|uniref:Short-chain dehydrogenase/reductase family protein n=1 Tax=Halobacillus halophilus (strain ATCC 35676 / DSM 2266 / JCM 20832 / KCTC 3685 / LMG 17431 / NBRC 102448 / NCIMB 2269) TaxID=866895 RepID=I0JN26_HALH3|nr:SDR family oxidoreductase [Halobacillus halophilus]ASF39614.1 NAD(P)-dependent oxidoreductase [Halobacillus halophilus]CCG45546.1 short-chain dehydrogenase/reductase family protein [Halobacillus halophilus DSM 2266]